jgi:hypothetical protein
MTRKTRMTKMKKTRIVYVQFVLEKEISFGKRLAMGFFVE